MANQFKRIQQKNLQTAAHKPRFLKLITFCSVAERVVKKRPIAALSENSRDFTLVTSALLLAPGVDPYTFEGIAYDRDHMRRD